MTKAPNTVGGLMQREMVTVGPDEPVRAAIQAMVDRGIGGVVVADDGKPVGVFTERDLLKRILSEPHVLERRMGEVMSAPVVTGEAGHRDCGRLRVPLYPGHPQAPHRR